MGVKYLGEGMGWHVLSKLFGQGVRRQWLSATVLSSDGLRNYATFEAAFAHAYMSHGRIQGLLAKMVASGTTRAWAKSAHA